MKPSLLHLFFLSLLTCSFIACKETPQEPSVAPSTVVYECNERLFAKANAFQSIEAYVPELERMQVNVLWLMPIHPRGAIKSVGSPYCIKNHKAIDPAFGTLDDLKSLVNTCHNRNIRVVLDWVANHTSWDNPWVKNHPEWFQAAQTGDEKMWNDVTFLDYSQQAVRDSMTDCMLYWINEAGIDGFRCDYAHGVPNDWWKEAISAIQAVKPDAFLLAETHNTSLYNAGFNLLYSWNYLTAIENLYNGTGSVQSLISVSDKEFKSTPEGKDRLRYITTHDECNEKAPSSIYTNIAGEMSAFCLTIFIGGVPMIYSSQEIGTLSKISFFDYRILSFNSKTAVSTRDTMAELMRIYQDTRLLRTGTRQIGSLDPKVPYVEYTRGGNNLLVVCNAQNEPKSVQLPDAYKGAKVLDMKTDEKTVLPETIDLAAYEYRIFKK